jgi:hypothetical protein
MADTNHSSVVDVVVDGLHDLLVAPSDNLLQEWTNGPFAATLETDSTFRGSDVPVDEYIDLLRALEAGPVGQEGLPAMVQRLRRLYFSFYTLRYKKHTSAFFDLMMNPVTDYAQPPLTTAHVTQAQLDRLFATAAVTTTLGSKVSPSHLWALADIAVNGVNLGMLALQGLSFSTSYQAMATWMGDIANAVRRYELALPKLAQANRTPAGRRALMLEHVAGTVSKGDLFGDFDGIAIGNHWARSPRSFTVSSFLQDYYDNETLSFDLAANLGRPSAAYRFHYFLKYADPPVGGAALDSTPFVPTFNKAAALPLMREITAKATDDMLNVVRIGVVMSDQGLKFLFSDDSDVARLRKPTEERLTNLDGLDAFQWLCDEFCRFIDEGVRTGDSRWPPAP